MKTIALVEYHYGGHHATYLKLIGRSLLELGYQLMIFSSKPEEIEEWMMTNCSSYKFYVFEMDKQGKFSLPVFEKKLPTVLEVLGRWLYAASLIRTASIKTGCAPDLVFFNSLDSYFSRYLIPPIIDSVFPYKWAGLTLQENLELLKHQSTFLKYFHHFIAAQSSRCKVVATLDEESGQRLEVKIQKPIVVFPDFADESDPDPDYFLAKQIKQIAAERTIVSLVGVLQKRKGVLTLVKVAQQCKKHPFFFVFAGGLDKSSFNSSELSILEDFVALQPENCFFHLSRIPGESQFNALIHSSDILFAAYEGFPNSSNILTKASIFKKTVVTTHGFCMGNRVTKFNLGKTVVEGNVDEIIQALQDLRYELSSDSNKLNFGFEKYKALNSSERLKGSLLQVIKASEVIQKRGT